MLIILSGVPGVGKTTIARELARQLKAVHIRIDSIEQAIRDSSLAADPIDAGYCVGYAVALDNLCVGRTVIADSVNPLLVTRNAWAEVAVKAQVRAIEIEVRCSNPREHQMRVENRTGDISGARLPTWDEVASRDYQPWDREHMVIDTAVSTVEQAVKVIQEAVKK